MIPTTDRIRNLITAISDYLKTNDAWRATRHRNPLRRQQLDPIRKANYHTAQTASADLHTHLARFHYHDGPADPIHDAARELIRRWDARNHCYDNLRHLSPDDNPREAIIRLDKAEKHLRNQIEALNQLLKIAATN